MTMNHPVPHLRTDRLEVRPAATADVDAIVRYYDENREHLAPARPRVPESFFTAPFWSAQVAVNLEEFHDGRSIRLFLFLRDRPQRVVGNINFTQIVRHPAWSCVVGYGLDADEVGRGLMSEGLEAAVRYMFEAQGMHRVVANYVPRNERSGRLLRRLGFTVEGYARDLLLLDGRWEDHIVTSRIHDGWRPPTPR
jgi:[ribosomal protein S5]-alanine N-acetyltransferase